MATAPMFAPDGSIGDIPIERVNEAKAQGFKTGIQMRSPDGQMGVIPTEHVPDAMKAGFLPHGMTQNPTLPTQFEQQRQGENTPGESGGGGSFLREGLNIAHGIASAATAAGAGPGGLLSTAGQIGANTIGRNLDNRSMAYRLIAPVGDLAGANTAGMEQSANAGNWKGVLGTAVADAVPAAASPFMGKLMDARSASRVTPRPAAMEGVFNSINPPVADVEGFKANLGNQFDTVVKYAKDNNLPMKTRTDFNVALQQAAKADPYRSNFIEPYKNEIVTPPTSYRGATTINGTRATIEQLDSRLSSINDELYPKYMKGGQNSGAAQAAINSGDAASLSAEANAIRKQLASEIAKRTGVDPEVVRSARKNYEQIKSLSEDVTHSLNEENRAYNKDAAQPLTIGGAYEAVKNRLPLNPLNWQRNPVAAVRDRMFSGAIKNYQPNAPAAIDPLTFQPQAAAPAQRTPVQGPSVDLTTFKPSGPDAAADFKAKLQARVDANKARRNNAP